MLENLFSNVKELFDTNAVTELRAQENRTRYVGMLKGSLVSNNRSEVSGISARVCKNGMYGFASSAEYSKDKIKAVLKAATDNALFMDNKAKRTDYKSIIVPSGSIPLNKPIVDTEQKKFIDLCRQIDNYITLHYPDLTSRQVGIQENSLEKILAVSEGKSGHTTVPRCQVGIALVTEAADSTPVDLHEIMGGYGCFDEVFSDLNKIYEKIDKTYTRLMEKREGVYPEAGYKTVVLGGILPGMLAHEAVGHTVEADLVKNGSIAGTMFGQMVASEKVTMIDYANTINGEIAPLPVYLDDEGVEAKDVVLIKDGKLVGYMNNKEMAAYYDMPPTGNARAWSYNDNPIIRMRNTAILPGNDTIEDMIASIDDGYYFLNTNNGQADLTGEFMFGVTSGYEIKKGKLGRAIREATVSGVAFDMLKTVDMISDKINWAPTGYCGKGNQMMMVSMGGPELRCKIMIGGR